MPPPKTSPPLQVALKPSVKLQQFNLAIHGLAVIAALFNNLPWPVKFVLATFVTIDCLFKRQRFKNETRILNYSARAGWQFANGGELEPLQILPSTVVTTRLIFLHIKHKPAQLIVDDALEEDLFRQLIVKLKLTANQPYQADNFP